MYVKVQREVIRESFTMYASRSMIESSGGIDALISNYASTPTQISNSSGNGYVPSTSKKEVYNLDKALPEINPKPKLLEYRASAQEVEMPYSSFNYNPNNYFSQPTPMEHFLPDNFLHSYRHETQFIDDAKKVEEHVKEAFKTTTGRELSKGITIRVCDEKKFKRIHEANGGKFSPSIQGFAIHRTGEVVVKQNKLDIVMLVLGHEIGHVLSNPLANIHDEEAKAFAFEMAWMKAIKDNNIAGIGDNINIDFQPANNGLHDVAFGFVKNLVTAGKRALDVFTELVNGKVSMKVNL
ncbi:hypothetical protein HOC35_05145 [Candidatus Woesearchaeota archaeon]|nr:hypothetical protein [Candidatus Woesearchaeota archaeon]